MQFSSGTARFHLPCLFEFYDFYKRFLPLFFVHRDFFYEWADIASIYGCPDGCLWAGGRFENSSAGVKDVLSLVNGCGISARLTFSNSLLQEPHLADKTCNRLCERFQQSGASVQNGVIVHSDLLLEYLEKNYPGLYFVSSTTKVLTSFEAFRAELQRDDFRFVVPDFRLNKQFERLQALPQVLKDKVEFLCNECCWTGCTERSLCYQNVSARILGMEHLEHQCHAPGGRDGYRFSKAMKNPAFIGICDIVQTYLPMGFSNFKIEGRGLGRALLLEFLLYYLTKPEHQIEVREALYLDCMLDLF